MAKPKTKNIRVSSLKPGNLILTHNHGREYYAKVLGKPKRLKKHMLFPKGVFIVRAICEESRLGIFFFERKTMLVKVKA